MYQAEPTVSFYVSSAIEKARSIRAMIFDNDGVFFPNIVEEGWAVFAQALSEAVGKEIPVPKAKVRSYYDGQGISLLREIGLPILFVTNEKDADAAAISSVITKLNALPSSCRPNERYEDDGRNEMEKRWPHIILRTGMGGPKKIVAAQSFVDSLGLQLTDCGFMCDDLVDWDLAQRVGFIAAPVTAQKQIKSIAHVISRRPAGLGAVRDIADFILEARSIDQTKLRIQ